jgi:uncharacterized phage protein (TIGR01671 family)
MREFKFRAWHKGIGVWCDDVVIYDDGSWRASIDMVHGYDDKECELMQYTGLKDKKGKEIYEGDILLMPQDATMSHPTGEAELCNVSMVGGSFGYWLCGRFESFLGWYGETDVIDDAEIIGNMWETPEFMEIR